MTSRTFLLILCVCLVFIVSCGVKKEDNIFHAGPPSSGLSAVFFGLYKGDRYEFCDGDVINHGCYTGDYELSGDTITLHGLKTHSGIPSNRFLISRFPEKDTLRGIEGKVFPLDETGRVVDDGWHYFVIERDKLKDSR